MTVVPPDPYTLPIASRLPKSWAQTINATLFLTVFLFGCLMINGLQFLFLVPLSLLPFPLAGDMYDQVMRYTKGSFGNLLILMSQWFAPTQIVLSFEKEGQGRFTQEEIENVVVRNKAGHVVALRLPNKHVLVSNHQVYADWWYLWCLTYFMGVHKDIVIILKKSLKWLPVLGWGMQFFGFIFLDRSWASDRLNLATRLSALGRQAEKQDKPLSLIIYPEGTLVSENTRPISKKYADKMGIEDLVHTLLPRSTGLLYSLRSLAPRVPNLRLIDLTVVYPGIPPRGYGQRYYTLRSIFFDRVPPPVINVHLRMFNVATEVPIGPITRDGSEHAPLEDAELSQEDTSRFDLWLRKLWEDKDKLISTFHETGSFVSSPKDSTAQIPVQLRSVRDILNAFCLGGPAILGVLWLKGAQKRV